MSFKRYLLFLVAALVPVWAADLLIIPHITTDAASFETDIVLENRSSGELLAVLQGFGDGGERASATITLAPQERLVRKSTDLFGDSPISMVHIQNSGGLYAGVAYIPKAFPQNRTYVEAIRQLSTRWRVHPSNWQNTFDGMVIAGTGCNRIQVNVRHYDAAGNLIRTVETPELEYNRVIYNLPDLFNDAIESYVEVEASHPVAVMALKGSRDLTEANSFLVGNQAIPGDTFDQLMIEVAEERSAFSAGDLAGNYIYTMEPICFCNMGKATGRFESSRLVSLLDEDGNAVAQGDVHYYPTIMELFDIIKNVAADTPDELTVTFDKQNHVPTRVFVDEDACADGDEWGFELISIEPITE